MTTPNKGLNLPAPQSTNWNGPLNQNFEFIDKALGGEQVFNVAGQGTSAVVLTVEQYQNLILQFEGALTANVTFAIPAGVGGQWIVRNVTTGDFSLTIRSGTTGGVVITQGAVRNIYSDGTDMYIVSEVDVGANGNIAYADNGELTGNNNLQYSASRLVATQASSVANTPLDAVRVVRETSSTPAVGLGSGMSFSIGSTSSKRIAAEIYTVLTDAATFDYEMQIRLMVAGATAATIATVSNTAIKFKGDSVLTERTATGTAVQALQYAGFTATADDDGNLTGGSYQPTPVGGNFKRITNGGAFTFQAPTAAGDYTLVVQMTNGSGAGTVTFSGFNRTTGNAITTTVGDDFFIYITKCNGFSVANVVALQ